MEKQLKKREEVEQSRTWDLSHLFKNDKELEEAIQAVQDLVESLVINFKSNLTTAEQINECLEKQREIVEQSNRIGTYVNLSLSVDQTNPKLLENYMKLSQWFSLMMSELSFIQSEILQQDEAVLQEAINLSSEHANYLKELLRFKPHVLEPAVERMLAQLDPVLSAPYTIYNQAKLADLRFEPFKVNGEEYTLSFSIFEDELEFEANTEVRREAFKAFSEKLSKYQNTVASVYNTQVQKEKIIATARGFDSVLDYLLFDQQVDQSLYHRQIDLIMEKLAPHMRKYAQLLKRIHGLDTMTFADLKIDVDPEFEPHVSFEDAKNYLVQGLGVLGNDYQEMVERSFDERWIDFVANEGKSTGAFCSSPYGAHPYILLTFMHSMRDVLTLAHELGHAGHFYLAHQHQNVYNSRPSLYFIEAPSTMNELLMANYLIEQSDDPRFKRWVLSALVGKTYYHNFVTHLLEAAYQREVYRIIDQGGSVQSQVLNKIKRQVLEDFWGDAVEITEGAELTWMRQPHYYMGLYPYTYSAGLTIATKMSERILSEGEAAIEDWRQVLMAGGTKTPVELAQMAKIDITTEEPLESTIAHIGYLIDEIIRLTDEIENN